MSKEFWENRWQNNQTGWDIGHVSMPLKSYIDQLENKELKILIPGCGNAYEAEYLFESGFKNVYIVEIAAEAIQSFKKRYPNFPGHHIFHMDFFGLEEKFDLILEQTFFCAIDPSLRPNYIKKMSEILNPEGQLVGVLFNREFEGGPPFGGSTAEYKDGFEPYFNILKLEDCYNSELPRQGSEVFINLQVK